MERLTQRTNGVVVYVGAHNKEAGGQIPCEVGPQGVREILARLAAYEDAGMAPDGVEALKLSMMGKAVAEIKEFDGLPIDRLKELAEADKEGRAVVLPCKVGDTMIYQTFEENPALMKNIRLEIAYESRCGVIFHMGYGIFADLVAHGRIKPGSGRNAEEG